MTATRGLPEPEQQEHPDRSEQAFDPGADFDRQVRTLLDAGYPGEAGLTDAQLRAVLEPLRAAALRRSHGLPGPTRERVPFLLVTTKQLVPADRAMPLTRHQGRPGFVSADTSDIHSFEAIATLDIPDGQAYVAYDVQRGADFLNVRPDDALAALTGARRSPLTVDEGIAFVTQFPESLEKNHCFSLAGSRCGDRRVPALWISKRAPKLGWCWAGNPHTWLGTASCAGRVGADPR